MSDMRSRTPSMLDANGHHSMPGCMPTGAISAARDIPVYVATATERDPSGLNAHTPGAKLDQNKLLPWLCISGFANALTEVAKVTTVGAKKYTPNGWAKVANGQERYLEAMGRHLLKMGTGETIDEDTMCYHLAQVAWNALASLELELRSKK